MKTLLTRLAAQEVLTRQEAESILINITESKYSDVQIAALLMAWKMRGVTVDEILGLRDGLLETGVSVDFSPYKPIDIVGTGGDCKNTFNISTAACFVVAGAGYKVAKHGNYAATSVSGASNVIEGHGVKFTNDPDKLHRSMEECGIVYLHAPLFARGMKFVAPVRKAIQIPTVFNLLGPLVNPCRPAYQMLGVANLDQMRLYRQIYQQIGIQFGIVNSIDGYDEISLTSDFKVTTNQDERVYNPKDLGLRTYAQPELYGGHTAAEAMAIFDAVLDGSSTEAQRDVVLTNAAFAIHIIEPQKSLEECLAMARESLYSGKARLTFEKFVKMNS